MKNLFKRNKTYYFRAVVPSALKIYFSQKNLYIMSLKTSNRNEAIIFANFLNSKLNYIKRQSMLLSNNELLSIVEDFTSTNVESIKNRHKHLTIDEIDKLINHYNSEEINIYDETIEKEIKELSRVLVEHNIDSNFDTDTSDLDFLVDKIVQIKLNVLHQIKSDVNKIVVKDVSNKTSNNNNIDNIKTVEDCKLMFLKSHDKKLRYEQNINLLIKFLKLNKRSEEDINNITNSVIKEFRNWYFDTSKNSKTTSNSVLTHLYTFFKFCITERIFKYPNPCVNSQFKLSVLEKAESQRDYFTDEDVARILNNLDLLRINKRTKKPRKYAKEYEAIIKIAMYSGARESEICQLKVSDVLQEEESKINYFRFIVEDEKNKELKKEKKLKNDNSWRFTPIHKDLEDFIFNYIENVDKRRKNLFTITPKKFGKDFSEYKTILKFDNKKVFHSFRHSVANKLKNQAKNEEIGQEITGHAKNTSFNKYAKSYDLVNKKEVLDKIFYRL